MHDKNFLICGHPLSSVMDLTAPLESPPVSSPEPAVLVEEAKELVQAYDDFVKEDEGQLFELSSPTASLQS